MAAWLLTNINRDSAKRSEPFDLEEVTSWLGYAASYVRGEPEPAQVPQSPPSVEELKQKLDVVHLLHKTLYGDNGTAEGEGH
jgi:hypothetical protein